MKFFQRPAGRLAVQAPWGSDPASSLKAQTITTGGPKSGVTSAISGKENEANPTGRHTACWESSIDCRKKSLTCGRFGTWC